MQAAQQAAAEATAAAQANAAAARAEAAAATAAAVGRVSELEALLAAQAEVQAHACRDANDGRKRADSAAAAEAVAAAAAEEAAAVAEAKFRLPPSPDRRHNTPKPGSSLGLPPRNGGGGASEGEGGFAVGFTVTLLDLGVADVGSDAVQALQAAVQALGAIPPSAQVRVDSVRAGSAVACLRVTGLADAHAAHAAAAAVTAKAGALALALDAAGLGQCAVSAPEVLTPKVLTPPEVGRLPPAAATTGAFATRDAGATRDACAAPLLAVSAAGPTTTAPGSHEGRSALSGLLAVAVVCAACAVGALAGSSAVRSKHANELAGVRLASWVRASEALGAAALASRRAAYA